MIPHSVDVLEYPIKAIPPQNPAVCKKERKKEEDGNRGTDNETSLNAKQF